LVVPTAEIGPNITPNAESPEYNFIEKMKKNH